MEKIMIMKEELIDLAHEQFTDLSCVNTKELGEVIDMIKDLSEAMYYCSFVENKATKEKQGEV